MAKLQVAIWRNGSVQTFDIPDDIPDKEAEAKKHVDKYIEKLLKDIKIEWHVSYKKNQYRSCSKAFQAENLDEAMLFLNNFDEKFEEYKDEPNFRPNKTKKVYKVKDKVVYRAKEINKRHPHWSWEECIDCASCHILEDDKNES